MIVATGGASYPQTGSTGDGYRFAARQGHTVVPANPSLVPLVEDGETRSLMGLSLRNVQLTVFENEKRSTRTSARCCSRISVCPVRSCCRRAHICAISAAKATVSRSTSSRRSTKKRSTGVCSRDFDKHKNSDFINALGELLPKKLIPVVIEKAASTRAKR